MSAVCNVFMYQQACPSRAHCPLRPSHSRRPRPQTAVEYECGQLTPSGEPQPFKLSMLWDVVRQLHPSMEQIFWAFSQSLDYNIGTASHTFAAMTALCEDFGIRVGDWMRKPPDHENLDDFMPVSPSVLADANPEPQKTPDMDAEEYKRLMAEHAATVQNLHRDDAQMEFPTLLAEGGLTEAERRDLCTGWARQRRATSRYRQECAADGHSNVLMDNPIEVISRVMSKMAMPPDATSEAGPSSSQDDPNRDTGACMPLYPSCVMADLVQTSMIHKPAAMVQWATGGTATGSHVGASGSVGVGPHFEFARRTSQGGACRWNCAWMRKGNIGGWLPYATQVKSKGNHTCKIFDIATNGLRDLFFLTSQRDNARRITEEPRVPRSMDPHHAFTNNAGGPLGETISYIRMRGVRNTLTGDSGRMDPAIDQAPRRHPYAKVADVPLQRNVDFAINAGRYPAMMPSISNNVVTQPPVRIFKDGEQRHLELNTAAAIEHVKFIAECSMRCSLHPGLEGEQEEFCDGVQGPEGMCVTTNVSVDSGTVEKTHKLPYAYDLPGMSITLDVMSRIYDPRGREYYQRFCNAYRELGFCPLYMHRPHLCTRYLGFSKVNRLLVSVQVPESRNLAFPRVDADADDADDESEPATHTLVSLQLGHSASEEEMRQFHLARAGSRAMGGLTGDILSMDTAMRHNCHSLCDRGMVRHKTNDPVIKMVIDAPYGLRQRLAEVASAAINKIIEKDPSMIAIKLPQPGDSAFSPDKLHAVKQERERDMRMQLVEQIDLPPHLEGLRHYGQLRLSEKRGKLTYQEVKKQAYKVRHLTSKRKPVAGGSAQLFESGDDFLGAATVVNPRAMAGPSRGRAVRPRTAPR